ncbi:hypothetical protein OHB41_44595 [Streptomyces sp. NBC_01571]|uniref:hypothetical protein n=1 Tax=Streptomyces sp. NBC_01571 TaxID=2975883 RepID=UPI002251A3F1|nr:hypothetical protein [Streptomyces sp. NBC_01571]MCX4580128.1 hypothetical protein [Streptomyces sp. NBC_01571]
MPDSVDRPEPQIQEQALDGCRVVTVRGDLDVDSLPAMRTVLRQPDESGSAHWETPDMLLR